MHPRSSSVSAKTVGSEAPLEVYGLSPRLESTIWKQEFASIALALLPLASFLGQYVLSLRAGTEQVLIHHPIIMIADWVFVPLNFFVVRTIDWGRGGRLYLIAAISVVLNVVAHAEWQYNGLDPGHMMTQTGVILPAAWVHLTFSILEMVLLVAFVFCRKANASGTAVVTTLAVAYFLTVGMCGYAIHHKFIITDLVVFVCGPFFVLIYPVLRRQYASHHFR